MKSLGASLWVEQRTVHEFLSWMYNVLLTLKKKRKTIAGRGEMIRLENTTIPALDLNSGMGMKGTSGQIEEPSVGVVGEYHRTEQK